MWRPSRLTVLSIPVLPALIAGAWLALAWAAQPGKAQVSPLPAPAASLAPFVSLAPAEVERRVRAWQPTASERRWEQIGWAKDIRAALRLARQTNRPVFLFTHDGRLSVGRC
jgi:hypothetical protein